MSFLPAPAWLIIFGVLALTFAVECAFLIWKRWNSNTLKEWEKYDDKFRDTWGSVRIVSFVLAVFGVAFWLDKNGDAILKWFVNELGIPKIQYIVGFLVLALGIGAYQYKKKYQRFYGLIEMVFGCVTGVLATKHVDLDKVFPTLATLGGCVYVVARGSINFAEGPKLMPGNKYVDRIPAKHRWEAKQRKRELQKLKLEGKHGDSDVD